MTNLKNFPVIEKSSILETNSLNLRLNYSLRSFAVKNTNKIIFPNKSPLNFWTAKQTTGELIELIFFGLNYNAKRVRYERKPFLLDLQKSHKIKVAESRVSKIKTKIFKRRLLLFSFDKNNLTSLVNLLKSNRPINSYSGHGLIARNDKYATKPGKIRQK